MAKDSIPALPVVPHTVKNPQERAFMQSLRDALQTRAGQTKNKMDSSPTYKDLIDAGVITLLGGAAGGPLIIGPEHPSTPWDDQTIPDAPTGLIVRATPWQHHVSWDVSQPGNEAIMAFGEVWQSEDNNRDNAVMVGTGRWTISLPIEPEAHMFYWVRYVSHANVVGPWSSARTDGVEAISPPDPQTLLDWLTGQLTESHLYQWLNDRIDLIDTSPTGGLVLKMTTVETTVDEHGNTIGVIAGDVTQLQTDVGDNYAAIQQVITSVDGIEASYGVKTDVNGHVAGFGFINTGNQYDDGHPNQSAFMVAANTFAVSAPGNDDFAFIIDAVNNRVVMHGAFILNATITGAAIGDAVIDTAHIGDAAITTAKIEDAAIANAKIGNLIQSTAYNPANGIGWSINKSGSISAAHIQIFNHLGEIIIDSGKTYTTYNDDIANSKQNWQDISALPDYLEKAPMALCSQGVFGNVWFEKDNPSTGLIKARGDIIYTPTGDKYTISTNRVIETYHTVQWEPPAGFLFFTATSVHTLWPAWSDGPNNTSNNFFWGFYVAADNGFNVHDGNATLLESGWVPTDATPLVATASSLSSSAGLDTFSSLIGVNQFLPEDGATKTPNGQMLNGGEFFFFANNSTFSGDPDWTLLSGSFGSLNDPLNNLGSLPRTRGADLQSAGGLMPCYENDPLYFRLMSTRGSGTSGGTTTVTVHYFNLAGTWLDTLSQTPIVISTGSYPNNDSWGEFTGVAVTPPGAVFCIVNITVSGSISGDYIYLKSLNVAKAPSLIDSTTIRTFIKDLSVNTLQLAGQAVTHSTWGEKIQTQGGSNFLYLTVVHNSSAQDIPTQIHFSINGNTAYDDDSSTRRVEIWRNGVQLKIMNFFYKSGSGNMTFMRGTSAMYFDQDAPTGDNTYEFRMSTSGGSGWNNVSEMQATFTELKK